MFGQCGLQNHTSKLPFILINTDNKRRPRRKDLVKVAAEKTKHFFAKAEKEMRKRASSNDTLYLPWLRTEGVMSEPAKLLLAAKVGGKRDFTESRTFKETPETTPKKRGARRAGRIQT